MKSHVSLFMLVALLVLLAAVPSAAALVARPCQAGATYDPACDVDHDGDVDIFDIQKSAGHWNQTGTWTSDNDHNHLGQVWTGANNPLVINGSFGLPTLAPLALSNSLGYGLSIPAAGQSGVAIGTVGTDGVFVNSAGSPSTVNANPGANGFEVGGAGGHGVYVGRADIDGVSVYSAAVDGVRVVSAGDDGVTVESAGDDGVTVYSAGGDGVDVISTVYDGLFVSSAGNNGVFANTIQANHEWGIYTPDKIYAGTALASNGPLLLVAESGDSNRLETGDLVVVSGAGATLGESESPLPLVRRASPGDGSVMGVVYRRFVAAKRVEEITRDGQVERQTRLDTRSAEGPVAPGDTLLVVVLGPAQVKVDRAAPISAGQHLTVATDGRARPLGTITVQLAGDAGTADLPEGAPVVGVAMGAVQDGLVWVMVNPQ